MTGRCILTHNIIDCEVLIATGQCHDRRKSTLDGLTYSTNLQRIDLVGVLSSSFYIFSLFSDTVYGKRQEENLNSIQVTPKSCWHISLSTLWLLLPLPLFFFFFLMKLMLLYNPPSVPDKHLNKRKQTGCDPLVCFLFIYLFF